MMKTESKAIDIATAHVEAWARHDWDASRELLASDVHVQVSTTQPIMAPVDTTGIEEYMQGLKRFAESVVPGTTRILGSTGDAHNALLLLTSEADFYGRRVNLPGARLYLVGDDGKIQSEKVIFYAAES